MGIFIFLIDKRIHVFLVMYSSYTRNQNIKRKCEFNYSKLLFRCIWRLLQFELALLCLTFFIVYGQLTREEWASPASCVHVINSSEFWSSLNVEKLSFQLDGSYAITFNVLHAIVAFDEIPQQMRIQNNPKQ